MQGTKEAAISHCSNSANQKQAAAALFWLFREKLEYLN